MIQEVVYDLKDKRWLRNWKQEGEVKKSVILTFDDGPSRYLNEILNILQKKKVSAIFFWQSRLVNYSRPWKRLLREGHIIGSHGHDHSNLVRLSFHEQFKQVKTSIDVIETVTGQKVKYFRPPFGRYNEDTMEVIKKFPIVPVMWEITSYDWDLKLEPEKIISNVVNNMKDGSIILLHELKQTALILEDLIDEIRAKDFEFTLL